MHTTFLSQSTDSECIRASYQRNSMSTVRKFLWVIYWFIAREGSSYQNQIQSCSTDQWRLASVSTLLQAKQLLCSGKPGPSKMDSVWWTRLCMPANPAGSHSRDHTSADDVNVSPSLSSKARQQRSSAAPRPSIEQCHASERLLISPALSCGKK